MPLYDVGGYEASFVYKGQGYFAGFHFVFPGEAAENNTPSDSYLIGNKEELCAFAEMINRGDGFSNHYVMFTQDIELTGEWTPTGRSEGRAEPYVEYVFYGTFDGDGHTISGVKIGVAENPTLWSRSDFSARR